MTDPVDYPCGKRPVKIYPLAESELDMLVWLPFWARRKFIERVKRDTRHEEDVFE